MLTSLELWATDCSLQVAVVSANTDMIHTLVKQKYGEIDSVSMFHDGLLCHLFIAFLRGTGQIDQIV